MNIFKKIYDYYNDKEYFSLLFKIAVPIALQNAVSSSLNMVSSLIIGQKGEVAVAAVGLAGQIFFLLNLLLFGIGSGAAIFTAQLWGKRDVPNIRRVLGLSLVMGLIPAAIFFILAEFFPEQVLRIYTADPAVIEAGSAYLRIFAWAFFFFAVTFAYALTLRSIGNVRPPVIVSIFAIILNAFLTYALVFGEFGFPEMGLNGAALSLVISRAVECVSLVAYTYATKSPAAAGLRDFLNIDYHFISKILVPVLPVIANEFLWSMGITTYYAIYARISTDSIAAINIAGTVDMLAMVVLFGISSATSVIVGNRIGAGENDLGYRYAARSIGLGGVVGIPVGFGVILISPLILSLYKVDPEVIRLAQNVLLILGCFIWMRAMNMIMIVGALRAGGDTRYSLFLDGIIIWVLGVPAALITAFVLDLPVFWVYFAVMSEEFVKWVLGLRRFVSRKWIHNLAQTVEVD